MVDYWLGPKWEGIDEDNPARIAFICSLNGKLADLGFKPNEEGFLELAKYLYDESVLDNV